MNILNPWVAFFIGAGDGNRTHVVSLEGWSSTIELHPHKNGAQGRSRTGTDFKVRRILSPVRLPVSPPGQYMKWWPAGDSNAWPSD